MPRLSMECSPRAPFGRPDGLQVPHRALHGPFRPTAGVRFRWKYSFARATLGRMTTNNPDPRGIGCVLTRTVEAVALSTDALDGRLRTAIGQTGLALELLDEGAFPDRVRPQVRELGNWLLDRGPRLEPSDAARLLIAIATQFHRPGVN